MNNEVQLSIQAFKNTVEKLNRIINVEDFLNNIDKINTECNHLLLLKDHILINTGVEENEQKR